VQTRLSTEPPGTFRWITARVWRNDAQPRIGPDSQAAALRTAACEPVNVVTVNVRFEVD
jgi:hypothetical protein